MDLSDTTRVFSAKDIIDTLRKFATTADSDEQVEGAYNFASELTGCSVDAISEALYDGTDEEEDE